MKKLSGTLKTTGTMERVARNETAQIAARTLKGMEEGIIVALRGRVQTTRRLKRVRRQTKTLAWKSRRTTRKLNRMATHPRTLKQAQLRKNPRKVTNTSRPRLTTKEKTKSLRIKTVQRAIKESETEAMISRALIRGVTNFFALHIQALSPL